MSSSPQSITFTPFRWFVLVTLFIVTATTSLALISPAPLIGAIVETPGQTLSAGQITWMTMGWFNFAVALAALGGGYFIDKLGFVRVHLIGILLVGSGWALVSVIGDTYAGMMIIRTLQGLGTGPIMASAAAVAAMRFPDRERGIVTGAQGAAVSTGVGLGLIFMPKMLAANGGDWQAALTSLWPVALLAIILTLIVMFGPKQELPLVEAGSSDAAGTIKHALRQALIMPVTWVAIGCIVLNSWVYQAFNDLSPNYLQSEPPLGVGLGAALLGYAQLAYVIGSFSGVAITDLVFKGRAKIGIMIGFGLGTVFLLGLLLPAATQSSGLMLFVLCAGSFFIAWVNPTAVAYISRAYPRSITGKLGGYAMGIGIFGGTAGVAAGSAALHATERYTASIVIMCSICALGLLVGAMLRQPKSAGLQAGNEPVSVPAAG